MNDQLGKLRQAVWDYLSEVDNPVPDYGLRVLLRNRLRELVSFPAAPKPEKRR